MPDRLCASLTLLMLFVAFPPQAGAQERQYPVDTNWGNGEPTTSESPEANHFNAIAVGFQVSKPATWRFVSAEENLENLARPAMDNSKFRELMLKYTTDPLVAMAKFDEPFPDLNPTFRVNIKPFGALPSRDPKAVLTAIMPQLQKIFTGSTVVQGATYVEVAGIKSAYTRINYTMRAEGKEFPTTSELWIVPREDFFFMIGAGTRQDEKTGSRNEIQSILDSVKIKLK